MAIAPELAKPTERRFDADVARTTSGGLTENADKQKLKYKLSAAARREAVTAAAVFFF